MITSASLQLSFRSLSQLSSVLLLTSPFKQLAALTGTTVALPDFTSCVIPSKLNKYWIVNQFPIGYDFRPRLRGRLTQGRLPLPWKP